MRRLAAVALVPTLIDLTVLIGLRQGLGWILVVSDAVAIALASVASYALHRVVTFHSDPYVRWVELPGAFVAVALVAGAVDVAVLRAVFAGTGFASTIALVQAKSVALIAAGAVRWVGYRFVLFNELTATRRLRWTRPDLAGDRRLSVVVPAYGEADRIADTIRRLRDTLVDVETDGGVDIVVVDDGSTDGTADAALAAGADQVVVQPRNRGKGAAVRTGVHAARGRTIVFTDADLAYGPAHVLQALAAIEDGWDVAIGDRRHPDSVMLSPPSRIRALGSRAINWLGYAVLLGAYRDTQSGLKAFRSDVAGFVFSHTRIDGFAFDIEVLHLVERYDLSLVELPVEVVNSDRSTVSAVRDAAQLIRDLLRIRSWSAHGAYEIDRSSSPPVPGEPGLVPLAVRSRSDAAG